jgi:hypothetical protein
MTTAITSQDPPPAAHARLIRAAADLIEQAGIAGLAVWPAPEEIIIQVPASSGDAHARARMVARLAALTGCQAAPDPEPGTTLGWIRAHGTFAGHPVRIYTPVSQEETAS